MPVTKEQFAAFAAAKQAVATEQAAVDDNRPSMTEPTISDRARELLRRGGVESVIDNGQCPNCASALVSRRMAVAAHNVRMAALTAAKFEAGYDDAREPLSIRFSDLAPQGVAREDLTEAETQELADIRAALGV